jgi:hypothetical protein
MRQGKAFGPNMCIANEKGCRIRQPLTKSSGVRKLESQTFVFLFEL